MAITLKATYLMAGAISLLLSAPIVTEVLPFEVRSGDYQPEFILIGLGVLLGIAGAPGYVYGLLLDERPRRSVTLRWIQVSLAAVLVASVIGTFATSLLALWLAVLPLVSAVSTIHIYLVLTRQPGEAESESAP